MKTKQDPKQSRLFKRWHSKVSSSYTIQSVEVQSVDYIGRGAQQEVLFMKIKAMLVDDNGDELTRVFFLRGSTVAVLVVLVVDNEEYALLVRQPRPAVGELSFPEIPAGIVEGETPKLAGLRELQEETGINVNADELVDLCSLFYGKTWRGVYPSPGACEEMVHLFLCKKQINKDVLDRLDGMKTGCHGEGEYITLEVVSLDDLPLHTPSPVAHSACLMYSNLKKKGVML